MAQPTNRTEQIRLAALKYKNDVVQLTEERDQYLHRIERLQEKLTQSKDETRQSTQMVQRLNARLDDLQREMDTKLPPAQRIRHEIDFQKAFSTSFLVAFGFALGGFVFVMFASAWWLLITLGFLTGL